MKQTFLIILLFVFGATYAQTVKFNEDFESLPLEVTSTSNSIANWSRTSQLSVSGSYSDSASITAANDTIILTTDAFSTVGYSKVLLKFNHIAKLTLFDGGYIEVSADNGTTWVRLNQNQYYGSGYYGQAANPIFNATSYTQHWEFMNNNAIPENSWWRAEKFDLSYLVSGANNAKVRFVLYGSTSTYGWLIDDIKVETSNSDIVPPTVKLNTPFPYGMVMGTGPYEVSAQIVDSSGVANAILVYTTVAGTDTVAMVNQGGGEFVGVIPSQAYGDTIEYNVIANDVNGNQNAYPGVSKIQFVTYKDPNAPAAYPYDVAMYSIDNPENVVIAGISNTVNVKIANKGDSVLTKSQIAWELDGVVQPTYTWQGSLSNDLISTPINIGNATYSKGNHDIKVYAYSPNDSVDQDNSNDTIQMSFYACSEILNGSYTLGGSNADFVDFADLMETLNNCGISGPTTIKVNSGIYHESFALTSQISGISSLNTLTIESASGNPNDVVIFDELNSNPYIVSIDSVSWVSLKNLTIKSTTGVAGSSLIITNVATNVLVEGCKIYATKENKPSINSIYLDGENVEYVAIKNCTIDGGYYGIKLLGVNSSVKQKNNIISGNSISNYVKYALYARYAENLLVSNNTVNPSESIGSYTGTVFGIYINYVTTATIESNSIVLKPSSGAQGIYLYQAGGTATAPSQVVNNTIAVTGNNQTGQIVGISNNSTSLVNYYFNSISLTAGSSSFSKAFYVSGSASTDVNVENNIFACFNQAPAYYISSGVITSMNYNDYYSNGGILMKGPSGTSTSTSAGITGVQAFTNDDANSIVADPVFYSDANIHSYGAVVNGAGAPIAGITTDIDGDFRSTTAPDMGADEFVISSIDAGVLSIISPLPTDTQSNVVPLKVIVKNYGSGNVTSMSIKSQVNGAPVLTYAWTGNLATGDADTVTLGNVTIPIGAFNIVAYTNLTGDTLHSNDSIHQLFNGLPLVEMELVEMLGPDDGCGKGVNEEVVIEIKNNGVSTVTNGITAIYKVNGGTLITENVTTPVAPNSSITYTFNQKVDLSTGYQDSTYHISVGVHHAGDITNSNDTASFDIVSLANLHTPIVSDTTINYGDSVSLTAQSNSAVFWYANDTSSVVLAHDTLVTPSLFDTITYYAQANMFNPPATSEIGTATTTLGFFDVSPYGSNMGNGRYQVLYTAAELSAAGFTAGDFSSIAFNASQAFSGPSVSMEIKLANVSSTSLIASFLNPTFTTVYMNNGSYSVTSGWNTHNFSSPFYWDGTSSLLIEICTNGNPYNSGPIAYTQTTATMVTANQGMGANCSSPTGQAVNKRPNIRIVKEGTNGCYSAKVPVVVNVPLPAIDAKVSEVVNPKDGCGLASTEVTIDIKNMGTDTIYGPYTTSYKVGNASYIAPETINNTIAPGDTLRYTFNTLASLVPGASGTSYVITAKVNVPSDSYAPNDSLVSDSIYSRYTPSNPIVTDITINYSDSALLTATAIDSIYWFSDSLGLNLVGKGSSFYTYPIYDSTVFYAQAEKTIPINDYQFGTLGNLTGYGDPSPYGAGGYSGYGARHQFLITADELQAMGMIQGPISSVSFDVATVVGVALQNYTIKMGNTDVSDMTGTYFINDLTTVYNVNSYTEHSNWNEHVFTTPFYWDGSSNIVIQTCFKNNSGVNSASVRYTYTNSVKTAYSKGAGSFNCLDSTINYNSTIRPNIKIKQEGLGYCKSDLIDLNVNVINYAMHDAGISAIVDPIDSASSVVPTNIKVVLKNYGLNPMMSASINWQENGTAKPAYSWTGNLAQGASDTITIATNYLLTKAHTEIKTWVVLANDTVHNNDTAVSNIAVCMSGTYTINPVTGDYLNFTDAVADLTNIGICGPVVFNVDSAVYNEQVLLSSIRGSSAINTVTFQSTELDSNKAELYGQTSALNNYVFKIDGASYITIKNLGLVAAGSSSGNVVLLTNKASNIEISNNRMVSVQLTGYNDIASAVYSRREDVSNINITNNDIKFGSKAILLEGMSSDSLYKVNISGNIIKDYVRSGIEVKYTNNVTIEDNIVESAGIGNSVYGLYVYQIRDSITISKNKIVVSSTGSAYGINLGYLIGTATNKVNIDNNFVSMLSVSSSSRAIYAYALNYTDIVYNSVNIETGSTSSYGMYISSGGNYNVKNNVLATKSGYALSINSIPNSSTFDYNNYYVDTLTTSKFVKFGSSFNDLAALQSTYTSYNQNSVSIDPLYLSATDLHAQQISIYNAGTPIAGVTTDIDNELRNATSPSIGADEFTPSAIDLGVVKLTYPQISDCGYSAIDSLVVGIKNYGLNDINFNTTSATIKVIVSGAAIDTVNFVLNSGSINSGDEMDVKVSNSFDLSIDGEYSFKTSVSIPNDGNTNNDNLAIVKVVSYPNINTFPYTEDFETSVNMTFKTVEDTESSVDVDGASPFNSNFALHFQGGTYNNWLNPTNVTEAFVNTKHIATAKTCNVDATSSTTLSMRFDLRQTKSSTNDNTSWLRVLLTDQNGAVHYLKDQNNDSAFVAVTKSNDTYVRHVFNLVDYVGQNFQISIEAVNKIKYSSGAYPGDNAFVDNINIWEISPVDVSVEKVVSELYHGRAGDYFSVKATYTNVGNDTLTAIPFAYQVDNGTIVRDTAIGVFLPFITDTFTFVSQYQLASGNQNICVFAEAPNDATIVNDTACTIIMGMQTFSPNYADNFDTQNDWVAAGTQNQWIKGTPNKTNITGAYSGANAWVTNISADYKPSANEYLYSPYFTIPTYASTAEVSFKMFMDVVGTNARAILEYSIDGVNWSSYGYIGMPGSVNWYNKVVSGQHFWALTNSGWHTASAQLDSTIFNTGTPFQFRFAFVSDQHTNTADGMAIDDFSIAVPAYALDAGIDAIITPSTSTITGDNIEVKVLVKNFGSTTLTSIPVSYTVDGSVVASETWTGSLAQNMVDTFTFSTNYVGSIQDYTLCAYTSLNGEMQVHNDTVCSVLTATPGRIDGGISSVIAPNGQTSIGQLTEVKVTIRNYGIDTLENVPVAYYINGTLIGNEVSAAKINPGDSIDYVFVTKYVSAAGSYSVCARTQVINDVDQSNDQTCVSVIGTSINDADNDAFVVEQNQPNPANGQTSIKFYIPKSGIVQFRLVNMAGSVVEEQSTNYDSGNQKIILNANKYQAGIYYYSISFDGQLRTFKMIIVR
jgi:hypothetical protein